MKYSLHWFRFQDGHLHIPLKSLCLEPDEKRSYKRTFNLGLFSTTLTRLGDRSTSFWEYVRIFGTLCLVKKKVYCHIILYIESEISTNNFVMQSSGIKHSGVITRKTEFIFLTSFIPETSKQDYSFKAYPQNL